MAESRSGMDTAHTDGDAVDRGERLRLARDEEADRAVLLLVASDLRTGRTHSDDDALFVALATNRSAGAAVYERLLEYPYPPSAALNRLASNPSLPAHLLDRLVRRFRTSDTRDVVIRIRVAENPATPARLLARLALDSTCDVRASVLLNPNTPDVVIRRLGERARTQAERSALAERGRGR